MTLATLAIGAACWFGPAWTCDGPISTAAWPCAGHTVPGSASSAPRCPPRRMRTGDASVEEDAPHWRPLNAPIAAVTTSTPARHVLRIRIRRVVVRAGSLESTLRPWAAVRCRHVSGFRYWGDPPPPLASEDACLARGGRALHGGGHPRWPAPGSDRGRHRR